MSYFQRKAVEVEPYPERSAQKRALDRLLCIFIISEIQPISVVDSPALKLFCSSLDPHYQLPGRDQVWTILSAMKKAVVEVSVRQICF